MGNAYTVTSERQIWRTK